MANLCVFALLRLCLKASMASHLELARLTTERSSGLMKRRTRTILLTVFVLIALLVSAGILLRPKPPLRYHGKTVYEWLVLLDPNVSQAASHDQARLAFIAMGKSALPELENLLSEKPNRFSERIRNYLVGFRLLRPKPLTVHEQEHRASRAAYILAEDANVDIRR